MGIQVCYVGFKYAMWYAHKWACKAQYVKKEQLENNLASIFTNTDLPKKYCILLILLTFLHPCNHYNL